MRMAEMPPSGYIINGKVRKRIRGFVQVRIKGSKKKGWVKSFMA